MIMIEGMCYCIGGMIIIYLYILYFYLILFLFLEFILLDNITKYILLILYRYLPYDMIMRIIDIIYIIWII